jgi:hypothetical protein
LKALLLRKHNLSTLKSQYPKSLLRTKPQKVKSARTLSKLCIDLETESHSATCFRVVSLLRSSRTSTLD